MDQTEFSTSFVMKGIWYLIVNLDLPELTKEIWDRPDRLQSDQGSKINRDLS